MLFAPHNTQILPLSSRCICEILLHDLLEASDGIVALKWNEKNKRIKIRAACGIKRQTRDMTFKRKGQKCAKVKFTLILTYIHAHCVMEKKMTSRVCRGRAKFHSLWGVCSLPCIRHTHTHTCNYDSVHVS